MIAQPLKEYLDRNHVEYLVIRHSPAYAAQYVAEAAHIRGQELAKVTMINIDDTIGMAVLPADNRIDFDGLKEALHLEGEVELAREEEFIHLFPDCEVGAMPPFGNLYGMKVYVADTLAQDEWIAFNAGNHSELIKMKYQDYEKLVSPTVLHFATHVTA